MTERPPPSGDPWIDAYLGLLAGLGQGDFQTLAEVEDYVREVKGGLPVGAPSIPAATFIHHDLAIRFPGQPLPLALVTALWLPDSARKES